jgi:hypothetical protein
MDSKNISKKSLISNTAALWLKSSVPIREIRGSNHIRMSF